MILKGKTVLVTGADGFIGSHLTEMLLSEGCKIKALSQYNSFNNWGWLEQLKDLNEIEVLSGDIRDPHYCLEITKGVDVIFHLAALIAIPYSYVAPSSYVETNISGTLNICQAALQNGCQKIIHTSTSEVYGSALYVPIDEKHPLQPQSPYSASKIGADNMAMSFFNAFNLPLTIARPFNTYGPRQSARAIIPSIISQIASGSKVIQVGDLSPTRDFNYVQDTCTGFVELAKSDETIGEIVNIGSNFEISIKDTFELIKKIMNSNVQFEVDPQRIRPQKSEVSRLWCDNSKIKQLTGFKPQFSMEYGLTKTIEWFAEPSNLNHYKTNLYNV
jgi:NAD dependent epimerase/dehydratase